MEEGEERELEEVRPLQGELSKRFAVGETVVIVGGLYGSFGRSGIIHGFSRDDSTAFVEITGYTGVKEQSESPGTMTLL